MSSKIPPERVQFVLCDDVRQEASGKVTLVGAFPGALVLVLGPRPPAEANAAAIFGTLSFAFFASKGEGEFEVRMRIRRPAGTELLEQSLGRVTLKPAAPATIGAQVQPFVVPELGTYPVSLFFDEHEYAFEMLITATGDTAS